MRSRLSNLWLRLQAAWGNGFYPCETDLVAEVKRLARPEIRERIDWQLRDTRKVWHELYGSGVLIYLSAKVDTNERERWYFGGIPAEVKWATIRFRVGATRVTATLWVVNGHLFSFKYDTDIRKLPDDQPLIVEKWTEHHDLAPSAEPLLEESEEAPSGRVVSSQGRFVVEGEFKGQPLRAGLPADWSDSTWRKAAAKLTVRRDADDDIPLVIRDQARFFALLGDEPDFLGVRVGSEDGELYWVTHEDEAFYRGEASCGEPLGKSMLAAVKILRRRGC